MSSRSPRAYALRAGLVALLSGACAAAGITLAGVSGMAWTLAAWAAVSLIGIAGGVALARWHGTQGAGFVVAMGTAMILRSIVALALLVGALRAGGGAYVPCLAGLLAGFVPQQVFEIVWFGRVRPADDGRREPTREA